MKLAILVWLFAEGALHAGDSEIRSGPTEWVGTVLASTIAAALLFLPLRLSMFSPNAHVRQYLNPFRIDQIAYFKFGASCALALAAGLAMGALVRKLPLSGSAIFLLSAGGAILAATHMAMMGENPRALNIAPDLRRGRNRSRPQHDKPANISKISNG